MSVYKAINAVQAELAKSGISKDSKNQHGGYNFRGIDQVYNSLSPLLAKHGLCILPRMLTRQCDERVSSKGGALFYVTVEAEFDFVCAEDGSKHVIRTFGEAMDSSDKATNKAMSAAYKYAAFQAFAIPTEGDNDADASSHEPQFRATSVKPVPKAESIVDEETLGYLRGLAAELVYMHSTVGIPKTYDKLESENLDSDQKAALWDILQPNSSTRNLLKKERELRQTKLKEAA